MAWTCAGPTRPGTPKPRPTRCGISAGALVMKIPCSAIGTTGPQADGDRRWRRVVFSTPSTPRWSRQSCGESSGCTAARTGSGTCPSATATVLRCAHGCSTQLKNRAARPGVSSSRPAKCCTPTSAASWFAAPWAIPRVRRVPRRRTGSNTRRARPIATHPKNSSRSRTPSRPKSCAAPRRVSGKRSKSAPACSRCSRGRSTSPT